MFVVCSDVDWLKWFLLRGKKISVGKLEIFVFINYYYFIVFVVSYVYIFVFIFVDEFSIRGWIERFISIFELIILYFFNIRIMYNFCFFIYCVIIDYDN